MEHLPKMSLLSMP